MAKSNLRAALVATLLAAGVAGCAADMSGGNQAAAGQPVNPNDASGAWNTPKGLDVGGAPSSPASPVLRP